jgi:hypothetical protein
MSLDRILRTISREICGLQGTALGGTSAKREARPDLPRWRVRGAGSEPHCTAAYVNSAAEEREGSLPG